MEGVARAEDISRRFEIQGTPPRSSRHPSALESSSDDSSDQEVDAVI